jgi:hypothetical protein
LPTPPIGKAEIRKPDEGGLAQAEREGPWKGIGVLLASGIETQVEPFPETDREFAGILAELRQLDPGDLRGKLVIGGFVDHPHGPDGSAASSACITSCTASGAICLNSLFR